MHVGSHVALWPESYTSKAGVEYRASPAQLQILNYWRDFWGHEAANAECVVLLGDLCQGKNVKDFGAGTTTPTLDTQVDACIQLLRPVIPAGAEIHSVTGSKYHDSLDTSLDKAVCHALGGQHHGAIKTLKLPNGTVVNVSHDFGGPLMYEAGTLERECLQWDAMVGQRTMLGQDVADDMINLFIRGHWHKYRYLEQDHRAFLQVPGWQLWYPANFMKKGLGKKMSQLGAVVVDCGPGGKVVVHKRLYEPPRVHFQPQEVLAFPG